MLSLQVKIPPPIVALVAAVLMRLITRATPGFAFHLPARQILAGCIFLSGLAIALMGIASFRRARTTVNPLRPEKASALVISGIYKITRNPMYLGLLLALTAWAIFLSNALAVAALPGFILYMNQLQIKPEEAALVCLFGQDFDDYRTRVRRWL